jgi:hypothetical protein
MLNRDRLQALISDLQGVPTEQLTAVLHALERLFEFDEEGVSEALALVLKSRDSTTT